MSGFPVMRSTEDAELYTTVTEREKNVRASYVKTGIQATSWAVLVDLSDETGWPHTGTGRIDISLINAMVDRSANTVGFMQLCVATRVGPTNGDATVIASIRFENNAESHISRDVNVAPSQVKCAVVDGATPFMITNALIVNDTGLQSDVAIDSPLGAGTVIPAVGDILVRFVHTSGGVWTGAVGVLYHGED